VNGRSVKAVADKATGFVALDRRWKDGDKIELNLVMPVSRVMAHPNVEACKGRVAIQRGPIVYGIEGLDNNGRTNITLGNDPQFTTELCSNVLGGITRIHGKAADGTAFTAIPYYAMANREKSHQEVWLSQQGLVETTDGWYGRLYRTLNPATNLTQSE
jgi:uncharacterized protein